MKYVYWKVDGNYQKSRNKMHNLWTSIRRKQNKKRENDINSLKTANEEKRELKQK